MYKAYLVIILGTVLFSCTENMHSDQWKEPLREMESSDYTEQYRPQFHFSPPAKWMNDPNGMVFYEGEYHLFYQYYPDSTVWGPMHWGHAVSKNLYQWEHLPIALYPDDLGYIFSGSAVIDKGNTSGLGLDGKDPMVAIFTHHDIEGERAGREDFQTQSIAFSNDNGRTWTKYKGNPVIPNPGIKDFRDPKVIWDEDRSQWVLVLAAYDRVMFYTSKNLIDWDYASDFGIIGDDRLWECPDLFPVNVQHRGKGSLKKWILISSIQKKAPNGGTATGYFIGDWDGKTFHGEPSDQRWLDYGTDNYAFVTWSDREPDEFQDRITGIGWMSNWQYAQVVPTEKWRSAMTMPRDLIFVEFDRGIYPVQLPARGIHKLYRAISVVKQPIINKGTTDIFSFEQPTAFHGKWAFNRPETTSVTIRLSNDLNEYVDVGYDSKQNVFFIDRTSSGNVDFHETFPAKHVAPNLFDEYDLVRMELFVDHSSVELFAESGRVCMTDIVFPTSPYTKIEIITDGPEQVICDQQEINAIGSVWR